MIINKDGSPASTNRKKRLLPSECGIEKIYNLTQEAETCYMTAILLGP